MQIGRTCSKMCSSLRFPEVVSMDGSLFATGGDEEEPAEWGVVSAGVQSERWMHLASRSHNPPYLLTRKTTG